MNYESNLLLSMSNYYSWLDAYTRMVSFEYDRFMKLHKKYDNIVPSEDIEKCWQFHIMCTNEYSMYCNTICGKFIHYNVGINSDGSNKKLMMIEKCKQCYKSEYGDYIHSQPWSSFLNTVSHLNNNSVCLNFKFMKEPNACDFFIPNSFDTIGSIKKYLCESLECEPLNLLMFISGSADDYFSFTIAQLYRHHCLKYKKGMGFLSTSKKESYDNQLNNEMFINRFLSHNIHNFDIFMMNATKANTIRNQKI
jgi:hypothetical protein